MAILPNSLAPAVGQSVSNEVFKYEAQVLTRKILIIGTYDPAITDLTDNVPVMVSSPDEVAALTGFGFMLHRLAIRVDEGAQGAAEMWIAPQDEYEAVQATGDIDFVGSDLTENGTLHLYIAGIHVPVTLLKDDDEDAVATKVAAAVEADDDLPVSAAVNGVTTSQVDFTAKSAGPWGTAITLSFNRGFMETHPAGVVVAITAMAGGAGIPNIQDVLDAMGEGDDQNEDHFTALVHGYGQDETTMDAISEWNGEGNELLGNYSEHVHKPVRVLDGDVAAGSDGKAALVALSAGRTLDRTNGIIAVPGSHSHPSEIAGLAMGIAERVNAKRAEEGYFKTALSSIDPGDRDDRWTNEYADRDYAVKHGITPTKVDNRTVFMHCLLTFYMPDDVPITSNVYRSMRNISILQNMLYNGYNAFNSTKWQGVSIVDDVTEVGSMVDREKARDIDAVEDELVNLTREFYDHAWIYETAFTINKIAAGDLVEIRPGGTGFNWTLPVLLSGEAGVFNGQIQVDTNIAIVL